MILPLISDGGRAALNLVSEDKRKQGGIPRKLCRLVRHVYGWEGWGGEQIEKGREGRGDHKSAMAGHGVYWLSYEILSKA